MTTGWTGAAMIAEGFPSAMGEGHDMTIKVFRGENITEIVFTDDATETTVYLEQIDVNELVFKIDLAAQAFERGKKYRQDALDGQKEDAA